MPQRRLKSQKTSRIQMCFKSNTHQFDTVRIESISTRKLADLSIEFHLLSAVWIEYIGKLFDSTFPSNLKGGRTENLQVIDYDTIWTKKTKDTRS